MTMAVMRNPYMAEAFSQLLDKNGGLVLGIGSGFQALVKLGLLPYGKFTEPGEDGIFITRNTIGRHMSKIVRVRVCSTLSPWYAGAEKGDTHSMPVSIMEGRFTASKERFEDLAEKGQIATQFADLSGEVSCDILYNPCGSAFAVEAITSPDGRILGRIGHAERNAPGLYLNVPGNYDESVFKSGVEFFL